MSLWSDFLTSPAPPNGRAFQKWSGYFPAYENHLSQFVNRSVVMFEIGVENGGSLQMWKRYFGPYATIVGLDIVDYTKYKEDQIEICTGDQSDAAVLQDMIDRFGQPDIVLDDGSHMMNHIHATFDYLYPRMSKNGVYLIEDLHTAYWSEYGGGGKDSFMKTVKNQIDLLNADHTRGVVEASDFTRSTLSMHCYDSMVVYERGQRGKNKSILRHY